MNIDTVVPRQLSVPRQWMLLVVLLLALILDGLDLQLLSLVSPLLLAEWHLDKSVMGPAMAAAMLGMSAGSLAGGWLGDRMGRRRVLIGAVVLFGVATLGVAGMDSLWPLTALRVVGGLGFGAAAPNAVALASEWLGGTLRTRAISWLSIGTPLGGLVGGMVLIGYLSELGWRGSFVLCGAGSLLTVALILSAVPESRAFLRRLRPEAGEAMPAAASVRPVTRRFVFGCGLGFFCISFVTYGCGAWLPVLVTMNGLPLQLGLKAVTSFNLLAVAAAVGAGLLVPRFGSRLLMTAAAAVTGVAVLLLTATLGPLQAVAALPTASTLLVAAASIGGGTGVVLACLYAVMSAGYPVERRAGGLGLGMMLGRAGGITSTASAGVLLGAQAATSWPFYGALAAGVVGAVAALGLIDRHLPAARPAP